MRSLEGGGRCLAEGGVPPAGVEPYFTTKPVGQGTGLGLDVSRRIITGLGGDLRVTSSRGNTVFAVRLPAAAGDWSDAQPPQV